MSAALSTSPRSHSLSHEEIERKLGSREAVETDLQRRSSTASRKETPEPSPASPPRTQQPVLPLSAISEASDNNASGSDSDSSSVAEEPATTRPLSAIDKALDRLRLSQEHTRTNDHSAVKSGYLMKKGERRKAWKKRWFVLRGGQVAMYKTDKEYRLLRLIPLNDIHSCGPIELKKHSFTFGIVTPKRTYYVQATSDQEVQAWCSTVERAKEEVKAGTTVTSLDTPQGGSGENTPVDHSFTDEFRSAAIPIPFSGIPSGPQASGISESYNTTSTSTSIPSPFSPTAPSLLSSSYTTTSTAPTNSAAPRVPPNSYAAGFTTASGALGLESSDGAALELDSLDAGLEQIVRTASFTGVPVLSSSVETAGELLNRPPRLVLGTTVGSPSSLLHPPPSPGGIMSSSEDDDGFDPYEPWSPAHPPALHATFPAEDRMIEQRELVNRAAASGSGSSGIVDPNKVILSGYLMKQGKRRNWRKRWFVLMSSRLVYSRSHMDTKVHRQIPVQQILDAIEYAPSPSLPLRRPLSSGGISSAASGASSVNLDDGKRNYQHSFKIITPKRTYLVCAPSEEDEIKWLAALQCVVARKVTSPNPGLGAGAGIASVRMPSTPSTSSDTQPRPAAIVSSPPTLAVTSATAGNTTVHGRGRSVTDAAKLAVRDVERRFHPGASVA